MMLRCYVWQQKWVHHRLVIFVEGVKISIWRHVTTVERRAAVMSTERGLGIVQSYISTETISSQSWLRGFLGKSRKMRTNLRLAGTHNCCLKSRARYYRSKKLFFNQSNSERCEQQLQSWLVIQSLGSQSVSQSGSNPASHPVSQSPSQLASQPASQTVCQLVSRSVSQSVRRVRQLPSDSVSQSISQPVNIALLYRKYNLLLDRNSVKCILVLVYSNIYQY